MQAQKNHPVWSAVDGILVINLDSSIERYESFIKDNAEALPVDKVLRLSAVLGRALPGYGELPWFTSRTGERARFWGGTAGCALSHRKAIEHAKAAGWRNVLIMEDDAVVRTDAASMELLSQALEKLSGDYMLYLGYNKPVPYGRLVMPGKGVDLWQVEGVLATHGYILPASMYDKVLSLLPVEADVWEWLSRYRAIDSMYRNYLPAEQGVKIYALYPVLVDQGAAVSEIGGVASAEAQYSCKRAPYTYNNVSGIVHLLMHPFRRIKVHLNSLRTLRRARCGGLPGYRKKSK